MRKRRIPAASRYVGFEIFRPSPNIDRAADRGVAVRMRCVHALLPVGIRSRVGRQECTRLACVTRCHVDVELRREVAELREPEAMLVDEVEGEPVATRRNRTAHVELALDTFAWLRIYVEAQAIPDDRIAPIVEPVVGDVEPAPRRRACILDRDACAPECTRLRRIKLVPQPPHRERTGRNRMLADRFQRRTSLRGRWILFSSGPAGSSRSSARRSGSCGRLAARCRSIASYVSATACSRLSAIPSSAPRSRCSLYGATTSMRR